MFTNVQLIDMTTKTLNFTPADDPSADRLTYASFPQGLREGMKAAAKRWAWDRETWRYQTGLIQETLLSGRFDANELSVAYLNPPKSNGEATRSDAMTVGATHAYP